MVEFKLVISDPKSGKSVQKEAKEDTAKRFLGAKLGEIIKGEVIDLAGYEFEITGGSDDSGFPMRKDIPGAGRAQILSTSTVGLKIRRKGMRKRKTVVGNTISSKTAQINLKVTKQGKAPLAAEAKPAEGEAEAPKEEAKSKAAPAEKPAKEKKEEAKPEEKKETPKEEAKEEPKPEEKKE
ncbi:30S ribosomal protein S6e [Nanoarchaeota archaeon]